MIKNKNIPGEMNQWDIEHDPSCFLMHSDWLKKAPKTEDILQLKHIYALGPILDVGYYNGMYKILIVRNGNWDRPVECRQSKDADEIVKQVYELISKYASG